MKPAINTHFNVMWMATREGYDGAPDANDPIGTGRTESAAILDLLEHELDREDASCA